MKSRTGNYIPFLSVILLVLFSLLTLSIHGQYVINNIGEQAAVKIGNDTINKMVSSQIGAQEKIAAKQSSIGLEFLQMKKWEQKYNSYLKDVSGYASALKAATHAYSDGVRIFLTLSKIKNVVKDHVEGVVATMSMNNLYMETFTEMVSAYELLKNAIAKGGPENMLTGAERSKTLWALEDKLKSFQKKLNHLYMSLRHYKLLHVWNRATAGMIDRDIGEIASLSFRDWSDRAREISK